MLLSCIQFCNSMDCSPSGFTVRRILQARILEWTAISFSRGSSQSRDQTWVSHVTGGCFTIWAIREAPCMVGVCLFIFFFYFTILYWFCHTSTWIHHKTVFQSGYSNLHSHQQCMKVSIVTCSHQHSLLLFWILAIPIAI